MWLMRAYNWFWWHTEVWIDNTRLRRPYTYIFRDNPSWFGVLSICWGALVWAVATWWARVPMMLAYGMLLGHLWWGSHIIPGQQESPTYDPDAKEPPKGT